MTLPIDIKKLKGTARPGRTNDFEPIYPTGNLPEPPSWLKAHGLAEWNRIKEPLQASGVVTDMDYTALVTYCHMWGEFSQAAEAGESLKPSKLMMIKSYASALGITPVSRSKVIANNAKATGNKFNGF